MRQKEREKRNDVLHMPATLVPSVQVSHMVCRNPTEDAITHTSQGMHWPECWKMVINPGTLLWDRDTLADVLIAKLYTCPKIKNDFQINNYTQF